MERGISFLHRSISFPKEGVISVDNIQFDEKLELSLFISRSDLDLSQVVFEQEKCNSFIPSTSSRFSKEEKEKLRDSLTTRLKEQLQHIENLKTSDPLNFLISRKLDTKIQDPKFPFVSAPFQDHKTQDLKVPVSPTVQSLYIPLFSIQLPSFGLTSSPKLSKTMAIISAPLVLPAQLHDLPQNYSQRIPCYGATEGDVSTHQHLDRFNDFIDLEEVDYKDVILTLFDQSFSREVRK